MQNQQRAQMSIVMLIIVLAIVFGVFAFAIYQFVRTRPIPPATDILVDSQTISLSVNPDERVEIIGDPPPPAEPEPVVEEAPAEAAPEGEAAVAEEAPAEEAPAAEAPPTEAQPAAETVQDTQGVGGAVATDMYIFTQHVVQGSDTLFSLANQYNTTIPLIARFGTSTLIPGQSVTITQANPAYCPTSGWYIAREGDTPGGIAAAYGTTLETLDQLNRWGGVYAVYETDVVCVP